MNTHAHVHTHTKAQFNGCTPARSSSPCSVCSFTPPHGLTKKMMVAEGWRLPLTPTLIQCQCGARVWGGMSCSLFGGAGVSGEPELWPLSPLLSLSLSLPS